MHEIHPRLSINSLCFSGAGIADIIESWHRLSPAIVSFRSNLLLEETSDALQAAIRREEYRVETISHTFISGYPTTSREHWPSARRTLCELIELARRVGAGSIYMLTGGHGAETWEISAQAFCEALSPCLPQARDVDIDILIEPAPMLYADAHLAHTLRDTLLLAEMADIGICIDIFSSWAEAGTQGNHQPSDFADQIGASWRLCSW